MTCSLPGRAGETCSRSLRKASAGEGARAGVASGLRQFRGGNARRALEFRDGILRVEVADAGWRKELQALAPRYVAAINRYTARASSALSLWSRHGNSRLLAPGEQECPRPRAKI